MRIAVLGTGNVGSALGGGWVRKGHEVVFGARDPLNPQLAGSLAQLRSSICVTDCSSAIERGDVILLAIPWEAVRQVLDGATLPNKVLVDCINPVTADLSQLQLGYDTSAAEQLAAWYPAAKVVKAFNTLSAAAMEDPCFGEMNADMFFCGDDAAAKQQVASLAHSLGLSPIDCGPLRIARQLEPLAMLYIHLAVFEGWGGHCALKMLRRSPPGVGEA